MNQMEEKTKIKSLSQFPDFDKMSYEEETEWWETHDLSPVIDKLEDMKVKIEPGALNTSKKLRELSKQLVKANLESALNIRLTHRDHNMLRSVARRKGLGIASLARMWILEKLRSEQSAKRGEVAA